MYLDSAYVAKYYVNERDATAVRKLIRLAPHICSSSWALVEVSCALHRHVREGSLTAAQGHALVDLFRSHVEADLWDLRPVTNALLGRAATMVRGLAANVPLRAGEALHFATAIDAGETEIWTNDRQMRAAATYFGLTGRSFGD
jgi:predicted nucleic acid-binding protein